MRWAESLGAGLPAQSRRTYAPSDGNGVLERELRELPGNNGIVASLGRVFVVGS